MERYHRLASRALGTALFGLGVAMIVTAFARGGGPLAVGVVVGVLFALLGAGRVLLARSAPPRTGG